MRYTDHYSSPLGEILLAADAQGLTGLWFEGQAYFGRGLLPEHEMRELPVFAETKRWLALYFAGLEPPLSIPLHFTGSEFQADVWSLLAKIPYGQTRTYGALARELAAQKGLSRVSARAVGGAVGRNPISVILPCHRVVGANGRLTGYAGGLERKKALLRLEGIKA